MTAEPFDLDAYKVKASSFRNDTYNACVILSNMGVYENNHWKALGRLSDTIVDSAYEWLSEKSDESKSTVEAAYESICAAYKDLILTDFGDNTEAKEIDSGVRSLFDGYSDLYTSVLNPSGSRDHFATHISELIDEIKSANSNLLIFLPEDEPQN